MTIINIFLITFLLTTSLIVGYIARREAGMRCKSDTAEFVLCIMTGVIILGILMVLF